jgi:hypothetical protein
MKASSIEILERHKYHWFTLKNAGWCRIEQEPKQEIESVVREELQPGYYENLWCSDCVAIMLRRIYTAYEKYLAENPNPTLLEAVEKALTPDPTSAPAPDKGKKGPKK